MGIAACATTLSVGCASNLSLKVGWDEHADFSKFHTWLWKPDGSIQDPIWARRCQDVLSDELAKHALQQVSAQGGPDEQAIALRDAMRVLFPEAVALVSAARQGFMRES